MTKVDSAVRAGQQQSVFAPSSQPAAPSGPHRDILLQFPNAVEVHKVEGKMEVLLCRGELVAYSVVYPTGEHRLALEVNETRWWLLTDTASLKVAPSTYMMALPGGHTFYSITFAEETPAEAVGAFEALLQEVSMYRESEALLQDPQLQRGDAEIAQGLSALKFQNKLARGIHNTSMKVADGILTGAAYTTSKFAEHSAAAQEATAPGKERSMPGVLKFTASTASKGAHLIARVADRVVNAAASAPGHVFGMLTRRNAAPVDIKPLGARKEVVWTSMECGARTVLCGARDAASSIVQHKYGTEAGAVAHDTLTAAGHGADAYTSYRNLAARAVIRQTAKSAAKGLLYRYMGNAIPIGMDSKAAAKLSVRERLDAIMARGGATMAAEPPAGASMSEEHRQMLEFRRCRGLLMPAPAYLKPHSLAHAPPLAAQK